MMIKGLAITPPTIGRIAIGHMTERNGKRLPEKDDFFSITTQVQSRDSWLLHPLHNQLLDSSANGKLRSIPVRLLFNDPALNLRAAYSAFDRTTGRPVCAGDGQTARRSSDEGVQSLPCPSPQGCGFGQVWGCKLFGRLNVQIEGQDDPLGSFIFRSTGYNSVRTLAARLSYFNAVSAGLSRYLPLALRLRGKSTTLSHRTPVYYVDLTLREGKSLTDAVNQAREQASADSAAGIDIGRLEQSAHQALANGSFEENEEDAGAIVEEFYPSHAEPPEIVPVTVPVTVPEPDFQAETVPAELAQAGRVQAVGGSTQAASPSVFRGSSVKTVLRSARLTSRLGAAAVNDERMNVNDHPPADVAI